MNRYLLSQALIGMCALSACAGSNDRAGMRAATTLLPAAGSKTHGQVTFMQTGNSVHVTGEITGLAPGRHGLHLHEKGDCSAPDVSSAGGHFNPAHTEHGGLRTGERHAGDFGNIVADGAGKAAFDFNASGISVSAVHSDGIIGRALVVHAGTDDERSNPAGNSGGRIACGVVRS